MAKNIQIEEKKTTTQKVGELREDIKTLLKLSKESQKIIIYPGVIKHIKRKHPHAFKHYFHKIPEIIASPDYVGITARNYVRIEYIKRFKDPVLVALKYDDHQNLFVSSMYIIEESRVEKRLEIERIVPVIEGVHVRAKKQKYRNQKKGRY